MTTCVALQKEALEGLCRLRLLTVHRPGVLEAPLLGTSRAHPYHQRKRDRPDTLACCCSQSLMEDPVTTALGQTYEKTAIQVSFAAPRQPAARPLATACPAGSSRKHLLAVSRPPPRLSLSVAGLAAEQRHRSLHGCGPFHPRRHTAAAPCHLSRTP
jgi:hypothetical protein